jgi:hypothetical protein
MGDIFDQLAANPQTNTMPPPVAPASTPGPQPQSGGKDIFDHLYAGTYQERQTAAQPQQSTGNEIAQGFGGAAAETLARAGELGSKIPLVKEAASKVGDILGLPKFSPNAPSNPYKTVEAEGKQAQEGTAGAIGGGLEGIAEFVMGDEALKGLSIAKKLGIAQKVAKLAEEYPTIGKILGTAVRTGSVGTTQAVAHGATPTEALETGAIAGATGGLAEGATKAIDVLRPVDQELAGEKIPIRASAQEGAKGTVGKTAEYTADTEKLKQFDVEKTQPAARKAASNVAAEAAKTEPAANPPKEDAFGFGKASNDLQARSKDVFQKLDDLSDRAFSDAQEDAANARQDYTAAGRKAYREALSKQDALFDEYKDQFDPGALDKAKADWKQSQGLEDLRVRFNRSVHPTPVELTTHGETDNGYVNGKSLRESITDALQKDQNGENEFQRAGFSPAHVQTMEDLGRIFEKGNNLHKLNPIVKMLAKGGAVTAGALTHPIATGVAIAGDYGAGRIMGKILTTPKAAQTLTAGLKGTVSAASIANALRPLIKDQENKDER